jgi:hypothetical protein
LEWISSTTFGFPGRYSRRPWGGNRRRGLTGLIEVLDVPEQLRSAVPEGLAALSFLADDYNATLDRARQSGSEITVLDTGVPGVDLFLCAMGGVPMEFMGSYEAEAMET